MANIKISFNGTKYAVDESNVAHAIDGLKTHLSTNMNGSGSTINFGGTSYNIDSTKLSTSTNDFASYLATIAGDGFKVVVNGVEYAVDITKMNDAISGLGAMFNEIGTQVEEEAIPGLYETGSNYTVLLKSWDELLNENLIKVENGAVGKVITGPQKNEWGFYYDIPYYAQGIDTIFRENGTCELYKNGTMVDSQDVVYTMGGVDMSSMGIGIGAVSSDGYSIYFSGANLSFYATKRNEYGFFYRTPYYYNDEYSVMFYEGSMYEIHKNGSMMEYGNVAYFAGIVDMYSLGRGIVSLDGHTITFEGTDSVITTRYLDLGNTNEFSGDLLLPEDDSIISIANDGFRSCEWLTGIKLSDNITDIGQGAFGYCRSLTTINIPFNITKIDSSVFCNCVGLKNVIFDENSMLTNINEDAFGYCFNLTNIEIPSGVVDINYGAFSECENLTSVTIKATTPPTLGLYVFDYCSKLTAIYVPAESVNAYKAASGWSEYAELIQAIPEN